MVTLKFSSEGSAPYLSPFRAVCWPGIPAAALACAAGLLAALPQLPVGTPLRVLVGGGACLFFPGMVVVDMVSPGLRLDQRAVVGFGLQLPIIAALTVATLCFGWNSTVAVSLLLGSTFVLGIVRARAEGGATPNDDRRGSSRLAAACWGSILAAAVLAYQAGVPFYGNFHGEDYTIVGNIRKLTELTRLSTDNWLALEGQRTAYVFAPYHFLQALVSRTTALDPIIVYHRMRGWWCLLCLTAHVALLRYLTGSERMARLGGLVLALALLTSFAGTLFFWGIPVTSGQLAPYSHYVDWPKGIGVPVALCLTLIFLGGPGEREERAVRWAAPLFACALFMVHPKELLQVLMFLPAATLAMAARRPARDVCLRAALLAVVPMAFGLALRAGVMRVEHAEAFETVRLEAFRAVGQRVWTSVGDALFGTALYDWGGTRPTFSILWSLPGYAVYLALGPALWIWRRHGAALFLAAAPLLPLAVLRVPALSYLFVIHTYSEALFAGETYLFPLPYLFLALIVLWISALAHRAGRWAPAGAIGMGATLAGLCRLAMMLGAWRVDALIAWTFIGAAVTWTVSRVMARRTWEPPLPNADGRAGVLTVILAALPVLWFGPGFRWSPLIPGQAGEGTYYRMGERPTLPETVVGIRRVCRETATDWTRRFDATFPSNQFSYPWEVLDALRSIPGPRTVDGPFGVVGPWPIEVHLFTQHYLVHSGTDLSFDRAYRARYLEGGRPHPIFCPRESFDPEAARAYLERHRVDYLVLDAEHAHVADRLSLVGIARSPRTGWAVYAARPH